MRYLKGFFVTVAVLVVALVAIAFFLPKAAHVERSTTINRPASQIFGVINDPHRFSAWSPWFDLDPAAKYTFSGPAAGIGAKFAWVGNKDVGSGSQEIVAAKPNELLRVQLDFGDMGRPTADFHLVPVDGGTKVTWTLDQSFEGSLVGRYFGLMMDSMVGKDYERGLEKLKALVETFPPADIAGITGDAIDLVAQKVYYISAGPVTDDAAAKGALTAAYRQLGAFLTVSHLTMQGPPMTITNGYDEKSGWSFDAAIAVAANDSPPTGDIKSGSTYAGKAVLFTHVGGYDKLSATIMKAYAWLAVHGYKPRDRLIQEYISDPGTTPVDQLKTLVKIPVET
ncbi:MAG: SRPBCC family protein [Rudaea sp.]